MGLALAGLLAPAAAKAEPECIYVSQPDPHSRIWLEDDGTLVTERLGERLRYPTSTGAGTGIMTRIYHPADSAMEPVPVLFVDLSEIAKEGAPKSLVVAFGNVYLSECRSG